MVMLANHPPGQTRRRHQRLSCAIPVLLRERQAQWRMQTENVSRTGAFVVTDSAKAERELVQLAFDVPDGTVRVLGMVAWRATLAEPSNSSIPGMGIDFFAVSKQDRDLWDAFVLELEQTGRLPEPEAPELEDPEQPQTDPIRRGYPRHTSRFVVRLRDRERMREFFTRDLSARGMFLRTPTPEQVSDTVEMRLLHPETHVEFPLLGQVVRVVVDVPMADRGVGVRLEQLSPAQESALLAFIETGVDFLQRTHDNGERLDLLCRAAELDPQSPYPLTALGQTLLDELQPQQAQQAFQKALARDATCLPARRGLHKAFSMLQQPEQAERQLAAIRRIEQGLD